MMFTFEINFKENKMFRYVHVEMALPKRMFKCLFFWDEILPAGSAVLLLAATNNKEFIGKSLLTSFCAESSEKKF